MKIYMVKTTDGIILSVWDSWAGAERFLETYPDKGYYVSEEKVKSTVEEYPDLFLDMMEA